MYIICKIFFIDVLKFVFLCFHCYLSDLTEKFLLIYFLLFSSFFVHFHTFIFEFICQLVFSHRFVTPGDETVCCSYPFIGSYIPISINSFPLAQSILKMSQCFGRTISVQLKLSKFNVRKPNVKIVSICFVVYFFVNGNCFFQVFNSIINSSFCPLNISSSSEN